MTRLSMFRVLLGTLFFPLIAFAQIEAIPYTWEDGNIALAYPHDWFLAASTLDEDGARLTLSMNSDEDGAQLIVEYIRIPSTRVFDLIAARLGVTGITASPPVEVSFVDRVAVETRGQNDIDTRAGIGRGTTLDNGSALILYGTAPVAESNSLLLAYDIVTQSMVLGATQLPRIPNGGGAIYPRLGNEALEYEQSTLGSLSIETPSQTWTFSGTAGELISIFATDINRIETLNLRLRLQQPDGMVIAENDNHSGASFYGLFSIYDAAISDVLLSVDGAYTVLVERVFGDGIYAIGVRRAGSVSSSDTLATRVQGMLDDVFAAQTWQFAARAGDVYTITMIAAEGTTLDPALRLFDPNGRVIEQNDDARDPALGLNAQLVQVSMPQDGIYRLEATRFAGEGEGAYEIVIVQTG